MGRRGVLGFDSRGWRGLVDRGCRDIHRFVFGPLLHVRRAAPRSFEPRLQPISLLLPVKLVNPGFARAQASAFQQDHPTYEIVIGTAERDSAALAIMRDLIAENAVPAHILQSPGIGAVSPKLDTLVAPLEAAAHDIIVTKDSNISFAPDTLRVMLQAHGPGIGLVCAVPVAVRSESTAGDVEAILINRDARLLLTASAFGKGFGVGKVMLFKRSDLARAGGVAAMAYTIAEDSALAKGFAAIGLRTVFAEKTVDQEIGARTLRDVFARQARWAVIRRAEEPVTFAMEPLACPVPAAIAGAIAAPLIGLGALAGFFVTLIGWYMIEVFITAIKGWEIKPWTPWAFIGRDGILLLAWARAWTTRAVVWAGGKQDVRDVLRRSGRSDTPWTVSLHDLSHRRDRGRHGGRLFWRRRSSLRFSRASASRCRRVNGAWAASMGCAAILRCPCSCIISSCGCRSHVSAEIGHPPRSRRSINLAPVASRSSS